MVLLTVSGLTKDELPGTNFLVLEVPGLCIGNGTDIGYVLFMTNAEGAKQERFKWYQKKILIKGVKAHRLTYDDFDTDAMPFILIEETAVSHCGGDIPYLKAVNESLQLYADNGIIANKQHAAGSEAEQPPNLAKVFKVIRCQLTQSATFLLTDAQ